MRNIVEGWIEVFKIFAKYLPQGGFFDVRAEHDVIYAGPDPKLVSPEDLQRLELLGWSTCQEDCFKRFV